MKAYVLREKDTGFYRHKERSLVRTADILKAKIYLKEASAKAQANREKKYISWGKVYEIIPVEVSIKEL